MTIKFKSILYCIVFIAIIGCSNSEKQVNKSSVVQKSGHSFSMDSDNFYVLHGGTNFGYSAGANSGGSGYQPDVTSYDYDAPINEPGQPTHKYHALKNLLSNYSYGLENQESIPDPIPVIEIDEVEMFPYTSIWDNLPSPILSVQPKPFEYYKLYYGFAVYKTKLIGRKSGKLLITDLHDYATVFIDGNYIGTIDRSKAENSIDLPRVSTKNPVLEILVEGMGRISS